MISSPQRSTSIWHTIISCFLIILTFLSTLTTASPTSQSTKSVSFPLEMRQPVALRPNSSRGFPQHLHFMERQEYYDYTIPSNSTLNSRKRIRWVSRYHNVQLYGGMVAVGEYYAKVKIGGQSIRVQIDTGSATLAVPLRECVNCKRGDMRYDINKSNSGKAKQISCDDSECGENTCSAMSCPHCSKKRACCAASDPTKCSFHLSFGDGSGAKGILVRDELEWGDVKFPVTFGGIRSDSPDFERSQVDGILGMAYKSLACNPSCIDPTFESMLQSVDNMKNVFTICITYSSGKIVLGDYDSSLSSKKIAWVPLALADPPSFYSFPLVGNMQVNGRDLPLPSYSKAIVDSGTTLIVFSHQTFNAFTDHLKTHYCDVPGLCEANSWFRPAHCTKISHEDRMKLPTLEFSLEGFVIKLSPSEYMINYASKGPDVWCVGLMALSSMSGGVDVIFGNTVMKKYVTVYDRVNSRVGFAESDKNCGLPGVQGDESMNHSPHGQTNSETTTATEPNPRKNEGENNVVGGLGKKPKSLSNENDSSNLESSHSRCDPARNCTACGKLNCHWDGEKCVTGESGFLMCISGKGNMIQGVVVGIGAIAVGIVIIFTAVHIYRKRQGGSTTSSEDANDVREPLAANEVDAENAFVLHDEEEVNRT